MLQEAWKELLTLQTCDPSGMDEELFDDMLKELKYEKALSTAMDDYGIEKDIFSISELDDMKQKEKIQVVLLRPKSQRYKKRNFIAQIYFVNAFKKVKIKKLPSNTKNTRNLCISLKFR